MCVTSRFVIVGQASAVMVPLGISWCITFRSGGVWQLWQVRVLFGEFALVGVRLVKLLYGSFGMSFCGEALQGTLRCVECMAVEARPVGPGGARPVSGQVRQSRSRSVWLVDVCPGSL